MYSGYSLLLIAFTVATAVLAETSDTFRLVTDFITDPSDLDTTNYIAYDPDAGETVGVYSDSVTAYDFQGYITSSGYFHITEGGYISNSTYLYVDDDNGAISVSNSSKSGPFEISDGVLYYQGSASFYLLQVVAAESYDLYWGTNTDSLSTSYTLLLEATTTDGDEAEDYNPSDASSYALTTTTSTTSSSSTSTSSSSTGGGNFAVQNGWGMVLICTLLSLMV